MRKSRLFYVFLLSIVLLAVMVSGAAAEPVVIRFQSLHLSSEPMASTLKQMISDFERANPDIRVLPEPVSEAERHTKFVTQMEAGTGPDVISIGPGFVRTYAEEGYLISLDSFITDIGGQQYLKTFLDSAVQQSTWGGHVVAIPHWGGAEGILMYNKELFIEAGLDPDEPPTTWDMFKSYAKELSADGQWGYAFRTSQQEGTTEILRTWLWSNGADILNDDETEATINSPEAVEVFEYLKSLGEAGVVPPGFENIRGDEIASLFAQEKIAMYYDGPWAPGVAIAQNPDIASKIGVAPPVGNKATLSPAIFVANGITRDSKNPEAAWKFIQYLSGLDANIEYARVSGFQSMRNDVDPTTVSSDPFMMSFAQYLKDYGLMIPQYPHKTDIDLIVATALQEIMLDIKPTKRALDDAAERINQLLQTAY